MLLPQFISYNVDLIWRQSWGTLMIFSGKMVFFFFLMEYFQKKLFVRAKLYSALVGDEFMWLVISKWMLHGQISNYFYSHFFSELPAFYIDISFVWCMLQLVFSLLLPCLIFSELGRSLTLEKMMQWYGFYPKSGAF